MEGLVDHFVTLDKLPDGVEFPSQLKDRIHFDAKAHKLVFHGWMSKAEFDKLSQLSNDWSFRRPLEELFRLCSPETEAAPTGFRRILSAFSRFFSG
jgi:hypothetical protein